MRILFVLENYYPHIGGVEVVFKQLVDGLLAKGHTIDVITHHFSNLPLHEQKGNLNIYRIKCLESRNLFSLMAISKSIELAKKADLIHTTTFNGAFPARIAGWIAKKPCVITVHEVWSGKWIQWGGMNFFNSWIYEIVEDLIYKLGFKKYICVSNSTGKQIFSKGVNSDRIATVHNAIDYSIFNIKIKAKGKILRKKLKLNGFVFFASGRPGTSKGFEYLAGALKELRDEKFTLVLMLSKNPAYINQYKKIKSMFDSFSKVLFLEPVSKEQYPANMAIADCVVVPSLAEGFGFAAAEACASGIPIIASNTTSLPEVVGGKYLFVNPADSNDLAKKMKLALQNKFESKPLPKFYLKDNINGYLKVYQEILN